MVVRKPADDLTEFRKITSIEGKGQYSMNTLYIQIKVLETKKKCDTCSSLYAVGSVEHVKAFSC